MRVTNRELRKRIRKILVEMNDPVVGAGLNLAMFEKAYVRDGSTFNFYVQPEQPEGEDLLNTMTQMVSEDDRGTLGSVFENVAIYNYLPALLGKSQYRNLNIALEESGYSIKDSPAADVIVGTFAGKKVGTTITTDAELWSAKASSGISTSYAAHVSSACMLGALIVDKTPGTNLNLGTNPTSEQAADALKDYLKNNTDGINTVSYGLGLTFFAWRRQGDMLSEKRVDASNPKKPKTLEGLNTSGNNPTITTEMQSPVTIQLFPATELAQLRGGFFSTGGGLKNTELTTAALQNLLDIADGDFNTFMTSTKQADRNAVVAKYKTMIASITTYTMGAFNSAYNDYVSNKQKKDVLVELEEAMEDPSKIKSRSTQDSYNYVAATDVPATKKLLQVIFKQNLIAQKILEKASNDKTAVTNPDGSGKNFYDQPNVDKKIQAFIQTDAFIKHFISKVGYVLLSGRTVDIDTPPFFQAIHAKPDENKVKITLKNDSLVVKLNNGLTSTGKKGTKGWNWSQDALSNNGSNYIIDDTSFKFYVSGKGTMPTVDYSHMVSQNIQSIVDDYQQIMGYTLTGKDYKVPTDRTKGGKFFDDPNAPGGMTSGREVLEKQKTMDKIKQGGQVISIAEHKSQVEGRFQGFLAVTQRSDAGLLAPSDIDVIVSLKELFATLYATVDDMPPSTMQPPNLKPILSSMNAALTQNDISAQKSAASSSFIQLLSLALTRPEIDENIISGIISTGAAENTLHRNHLKQQAGALKGQKNEPTNIDQIIQILSENINLENLPEELANIANELLDFGYVSFLYYNVASSLQYNIQTREAVNYIAKFLKACEDILKASQQQQVAESKAYENILKKILYTAKKRR